MTDRTHDHYKPNSPYRHRAVVRISIVRNQHTFRVIETPVANAVDTGKVVLNV
jgi:hypothetical protein